MAVSAVTRRSNKLAEVEIGKLHHASKRLKVSFQKSSEIQLDNLIFSGTLENNQNHTIMRK